MNEWYFSDVPRLMSETDALYARIVAKAPEKTKEAVTAQRIVEERNWGGTRDLYKDRMEAVIKRLGYFYVPRLMVPGSLFVFPMRGTDGKVVCAQTKPLEGSVLFSDKRKYRQIGEKSEFYGPTWLGNDPETLKAVIEKQAVMCVEGPFDLLAMRLMCPDYPLMSPLTKHLGRQHEAYLRLLGVKRLLLMYDNEDEGQKAMERQERQIKTMAVTPCKCPQHDPSKALEKWEWAKDLGFRIRQYFGY